jgi:hypothetical protein
VGHRHESLEFVIGLGDAELARAVDLAQLGSAARTSPGVGPPNLRALLNPPGAVEAAVVNSEGLLRGSLRHGFVTGTMGGHHRSDAVENALRDVLGLPSL